MEFFKGILSNSQPNSDLLQKQSILDSSEDEHSDSDSELDEIQSSQKPLDAKMAGEGESSNLEKSLHQEPSETPRTSKKRKISETADDNVEVEDMTDRAVLDKILLAVEGGDKKSSKRFKSHAKTLNTLKVNDEILNMEVQSLKHESVAIRKFVTNKLHQMNRDVNSMKFEESNVIIYDLKMSDLQPLIKNNNVNAAVQKFGFNFIKRYIDNFKQEDFKATKLEAEGEAEDGGDKWRMMLRLASTHFAQVLMWRMKQRRHWNFRGGLSKMSRDQNNLIEEEVKRKNARLDANSEIMYKRKFGNKIAVVKKSDPHKTVRFEEPFNPQPFAKSKIEMGNRIVEHEEDINVEDSEDDEEEMEEGSEIENSQTSENSQIVIEDTPNSTPTELASKPAHSKNGSASSASVSNAGKKRLSVNGKPLGRPPGTKTSDSSKIKRSSQATSGTTSLKSKSSLRTFNSNATRKILREGLNERDNLIAQQQAKNEELLRELERFRAAEKLANTSSGDDTRTT